MRSIMFIAILSILVTGSLAQASGDFQLPEQYIQWPLEKRDLELGALDFELIRGLYLSAGTSPERVMDKLLGLVWENRHRPTYDSTAADILSELNDGKEQCSYILVKQFLTKYVAYKVTAKTEMRPEVMLNFLEHYGKKKFPACASEAISAMKEVLVTWSDVHAAPIRFFKLVLSLDKKATDSQFYDELRRFKPFQSKINVGKLARSCERKTRDESTAERIKGKFDKMCAIIKAFHGGPLNVLNLANYFAPDEKYFEKNPDIGAMNELRRACVEMQDGDALLEHLEKLCMEKCSSFGCFGL